MQITDLSLPYPVLGINDDYLSSKYSSEIEVAPSEFDMEFVVKHELTNKKLNNLIADKKIKFCVEINCPSTFYRNSFLSYDVIQTFKIKQELLRGKFYIYFYIVSEAEIPAYTNSDFNEDYLGQKFDIGIGDILAYGGRSKFTAIKNWNALKAVKTFMTITGDAELEYMDVYLGPDKIYVQLPQKDIDKYMNIASYDDVRPILHSSLAYPALVYALTEVLQNPGQYEKKEWLQFIKTKIEHDPNLSWFNWQNHEEINRFAQEMFGKPIKRMIESIDYQKNIPEE